MRPAYNVPSPLIIYLTQGAKIPGLVVYIYLRVFSVYFGSLLGYIRHRRIQFVRYLLGNRGKRCPE